MTDSGGRAEANLRLATAIFALVLVPGFGFSGWPALAAFSAAAAYAVWAFFHRGGSSARARRATSVADAGLVGLWVLATGGVASPFLVFWSAFVFVRAFDAGLDAGLEAAVIAAVAAVTVFSGSLPSALSVVIAVVAAPFAAAVFGALVGRLDDTPIEGGGFGDW